MKWLTLAGILLYLTRHGEAGVLKCSPESQDPLCASEKKRNLIPPPQKPYAECQAGTEWESNCHYCRCSESGVAECLKQDSCDLLIYDDPIKCKPKTTFQQDCNICTCLDNGLGLCTLKACNHYPVQDITNRRRRQANPQGECVPGTSWKKECNNCRCTDNGLALCTRKGCNVDLSSSVQKRDTSSSVTTITQNHVIIKRAVCKPNQEFQLDCNPCKCAANGQSYTCTHNECLEGATVSKDVEVFMESEGSDHIENHSVCKPREVFYIGCNPCHCNAYGTDYTCTNKPCPLPKDVEIFHELTENTTKSSNNTKQVVCVANRMFIRDCNTCWCNEDGTSFFCTRRICIPDSSEENITEDPEFSEAKLRVEKKECRPNEVFEMDCNMCRCSADGKSVSCTRRACVEFDNKNATLVRQTRAAPEPPKTCQPGTEFRMDCNKCLCNDEGHDFSCTRIDCTAQNGNSEVDSFAGTRTKREVSVTEKVAMKCEAGSVFDRECNVCRCTEDGLHAVCTIKRCGQELAEPSTEPTPSFRCTPGDQFKRECNDCHCSADGKTVFCTLRLCDVELADM